MMIFLVFIPFVLLVIPPVVGNKEFSNNARYVVNKYAENGGYYVYSRNDTDYTPRSLNSRDIEDDIMNEVERYPAERDPHPSFCRRKRF